MKLIKIPGTRLVHAIFCMMLILRRFAGELMFFITPMLFRRVRTTEMGLSASSWNPSFMMQMYVHISLLEQSQLNTTSIPDFDQDLQIFRSS